ncbi:LytR/AlgR family response regulator transcription factor [Spirosoma montaniterrae]|uniref:Two-component system response regulator n=1 Tax=Spirosoma montaniterrae TaxID=1178516 RepID=A0A1P9WYI4_9BACT|nr:LytTR family DNA-binding domain-containing protein [Spirosoma montaniterrae]AQG80413.1 two-component system response regulator [Spirosoma montaniterrae]
MKPIRCLAVDDEPLALALLADNIGKVPFLTLAATCDDPLEALAVLERESIDLLFLDIQMPGLTGTQLLQGLINRPPVILITAYEQYALEGFNLSVLDYLLKPVDFSRFLQAAQKAQRFIQPTEQMAPAADDFFFVNSDYSLVRIQVGSVLYVEGLKDYVKIYTTQHSRPVLSRMTLKAMEELLSRPRFVRIHRSYIVSINHVEVIRRHKITLAGVSIPLGEQYAPGLYELLNLNPRTISE